MAGLLTEEPLVENGEGRVGVVVSGNDPDPVLVAMLAGGTLRANVSCFTEGGGVLQSISASKSELHIQPSGEVKLQALNDSDS